MEAADARSLRALGECLGAGVPLAQSLDLAIRAGAGGRAAFDLRRARTRLLEGPSLAASLENLPPEICHRLAVAEEAGDLDITLRRVAEELRGDVEARRKKVASLLPMAVLLTIGAIIAWRVFQFYGDYYNRLNQL